MHLGGLEPGKHTATIELVGNDNKSYSPRALDTVTFRTTEKIPGKIGKLDYKSDKVDVSGVEIAAPTPGRYILLAIALALVAAIVYFFRKRSHRVGRRKKKKGNNNSPETPEDKQTDVIQM